MKVSKRRGPRRSPARLFAPRTFSSNQHFTLKKNPLRRHHLDEFVRLYNPESRHEREPTFSEENPEGRWRRYSYEEIMRREGGQPRPLVDPRQEPLRGHGRAEGHAARGHEAGRPGRRSRPHLRAGARRGSSRLRDRG